MNWLYFIAAAWMALGALLNIAQVGKEREPLTGGTVSFAVIIAAGIITLLVIAGINA